MAVVTLRAHFDGERIVLDEPGSIPTDARLLVTILEHDIDGRDELMLAKMALARAYGPDEPEYSEADILR